MAKRYNWTRIVSEARAQPGVLMLAVTAVPMRTVETVNERRLEVLELDDGTLRAELRNRYIDGEGRLRGDMFVVFHPAPKESS